MTCHAMPYVRAIEHAIDLLRLQHLGRASRTIVLAIDRGAELLARSLELQQLWMLCDRTGNVLIMIIVVLEGSLFDNEHMIAST